MTSDIPERTVAADRESADDAFVHATRAVGVAAVAGYGVGTLTHPDVGFAVAALFLLRAWSRGAHRRALLAESAAAATLKADRSHDRTAFIAGRRRQDAADAWHTFTGRIRRAVDLLLAPIFRPIEALVAAVAARTLIPRRVRAIGDWNTRLAGFLIAMAAHVPFQLLNIHFLPPRFSHHEIFHPLAFLALTQLLYLLPLRWVLALLGARRAMEGVTAAIALVALLQGGLCMVAR